jgi:arginyl-tRNA synthetase
LLRFTLAQIVTAAVEALVLSGKLPEAVREVPVEIIDTRQPDHGDFACNFAMMATKKAGMNPRAIGELLREALLDASAGQPVFSEVEVAGPGFINLRLAPAFVSGYVGEVLALGEELARPKPAGSGQRVNIEFVSVNPNGPITVGSGRGAAFGSALSNVLQAAGGTVHREYYINDGVNSEQMRLFAESVRAYVEDLPFPEKGYKGEYVQDVAARIAETHGSRGDIGWYQQTSQDLMIERQRGDLSIFAVDFDTWFSEQSLHDAGKVEALLEKLVAKGVADEEPYRTKIVVDKSGTRVEREDQPTEDEEGDDASGDSKSEGGKTLWLRSTKFGDDMDRVLRRKDGRLTYIASDVAYHADKFNRPPNADKLMTILGPDHHGYIGRLHAVVAALLEDAADVPAAEPLSEIDALIYQSPEERDRCRRALEESKRRLEVIIFQIVRFLKDGKPAPMRKRDGNIYELRDLVDEVGKAAAPTAPTDEQRRIGKDVARFFYLMRSHDTHMDFDIDLATKQSDENPVFYAQYAHARICSVLRKAEAAGMQPHPGNLEHPREITLIKKILDLPWEVDRCAQDYGVHRLTTYAVELARTYHHFYDACRVISPEDPELSSARLALCQAARIALKATFDLIGVSAPERMDRAG